MTLSRARYAHPNGRRYVAEVFWTSWLYAYVRYRLNRRLVYFYVSAAALSPLA